MDFGEIEEVFNRSFKFAFSRKKALLVFPVLLICGVLVVFCRAISFGAGSWIGMSLVFLPIFLCTGILLALGVVLARIYYHEVKKIPYEVTKLMNQSMQVLVGISYLSIPLVLIYLFLWALMGIFHLLKGLPAIGDFIGVLLSFGPFLLVSASLFLVLGSLAILFLVTPHVALKSEVHLQIAEEIIERVKVSVFANIILFCMGIIPLLIGGGILVGSAVITGSQYLSATRAISSSLEWFFVMLPFAMILTPFVIFFFNFATESFALLQKRRKQEVKAPEEESCVLQ